MKRDSEKGEDNVADLVDTYSAEFTSSRLSRSLGLKALLYSRTSMTAQRSADCGVYRSIWKSESQSPSVLGYWERRKARIDNRCHGSHTAIQWCASNLLGDMTTDAHKTSKPYATPYVGDTANPYMGTCHDDLGMGIY